MISEIIKYPCSICENNEVRLIYSDQIYNIDIVICSRCGFVFQKIKFNITVDSWDTQQDYLEHSRRRAEYIKDFCLQYIAKYKKLNILDVGCGHGGVLLAFRDMMPKKTILTGYTLTKDIKYDKMLRKKNVNVIYDDIFVATISDKTNFVVMSHVLEHFKNPYTILYRLTRQLKYGTLIYIEVPSYHWGRIKTDPIYTKEHMSYFTKRSLLNLMSRVGLSVIKYKESKYHGNIKILVGITPTTKMVKAFGVLNGNIKTTKPIFVLIKHFIIGKLIPVFKFIKKHKAIGVND